MTVQFVGGQFGYYPRVIGMVGGIDSTIDDGDYVFVWSYYPNTMTFSFDSLTGWHLLRKTVGSLATVELWWRQWHTGDIQQWPTTLTGYGSPDISEIITVAFRGLIADPTVVSATHETTSSPAVVDAVTDGSIGNADVALCCFATKLGSFSGATSPVSYGVGTGGTPYVEAVSLITGTTGVSGAVTQPGTGTNGAGADLFGVQVILPDVPIATGGWGIGQVRMGAN